MRRTMNRIKHVFLLALLLACAAGCSGQYQHKRLAKDSPEQNRIVQLLSALQSAAPGDLESTVTRDQRHRPG